MIARIGGEAKGSVATFPGVKKYLKLYLRGPWNSEQHMNDLRRFAAGEHFVLANEFTSHAPAYGVIQVIDALGELALDKFWHAIHEALQAGDGWQRDWRQAVLFDYWRCRFQYAWHVHAFREFQSGVRRQQLRTMYLMNQGFALGCCLSLGWFDFAVALAREGYAAFDDKFFVECDDGYASSRMHFFMLRLVANWQRWPSHPLDSIDLSPSPYDEILRHWRSVDTAVLSSSLLRACDRHMEQSHVNKRGTKYELWLNYMWYVPFEVLSVLRLRESLGLENPPLEHPLLDTPLGKLQAIVAPESNITLEATVRRVHRLLPETDLA